MYILKDVDGDNYNIWDTRDSTESLVPRSTVADMYLKIPKLFILGIRYLRDGHFAIKENPYIYLELEDNSALLMDGYYILKLEKSEIYNFESYFRPLINMKKNEQLKDLTLSEIQDYLHIANASTYSSKNFNTSNSIKCEEFGQNNIICDDGYSYGFFDIIYSYIYDDTAIDIVTYIDFDKIEFNNGVVWTAKQATKLYQDKLPDKSQVLSYYLKDEEEDYLRVEANSVAMDKLLDGRNFIWVNNFPVLDFRKYKTSDSKIKSCSRLFDTIESFNNISIEELLKSRKDSDIEKINKFCRLLGINSYGDYQYIRQGLPANLQAIADRVRQSLVSACLRGSFSLPDMKIKTSEIINLSKNREILKGYSSSTVDTISSVLYYTDCGLITIDKKNDGRAFVVCHMTNLGMVVYNPNTNELEWVQTLNTCRFIGQDSKEYSELLYGGLEEISYMDYTLLPLSIGDIYSYDINGETYIEINIRCLGKPWHIQSNKEIDNNWAKFGFSVIEVPLLFTGIPWIEDENGRICFRTLFHNVTFDKRILDKLIGKNFRGIKEDINIYPYFKNKSNGKSSSEAIKHYKEDFTRSLNKMFSVYRETYS